MKKIRFHRHAWCEFTAIMCEHFSYDFVGHGGQNRAVSSGHFEGIHPVRSLSTMYFYHSENFSKRAYSQNKNREALKQGKQRRMGS